eukprot:4411061-Pleurochrysis_carterae.AAC.3
MAPIWKKRPRVRSREARRDACSTALALAPCLVPRCSMLCSTAGPVSCPRHGVGVSRRLFSSVWKSICENVSTASGRQ